MSSGINAVMNSYFKYSQSNPKNVEAISKVFDFTGAVKSTRSMLESYRANTSKVKQLGKETADFLTGYTKSMNALNQSAGKLADGGAGKILYDQSGNVTADTVKNTVDAVRGLVDNYNSSLKTLSDNASRGPAVAAQKSLMQDNPALQDEMALAGVSVNEDGNLQLDEAALGKALSDEAPERREQLLDLIGERGGLAAEVRDAARVALRRPAQSLIANDLAEMQAIRNEDPIRTLEKSVRGGGAYAMNNNAAMGILMNMTA